MNLDYLKTFSFIDFINRFKEFDLKEKDIPFAHEKRERAMKAYKKYLIKLEQNMIQGWVMCYCKKLINKILNDRVDECKHRQGWELFRYERNKLLTKTDWSQQSDTPLSTDLRKRYRKYRQWLRDLPKMIRTPSLKNLKTFEEWQKHN